jgi:hypothetical protein
LYKKVHTATISVGRLSNGAFEKPVHEFDPRSVHKNNGDAPSKLDGNDPA